MKFSQVSNEQFFEEDPIFFSKFVSNTSLVRKYNLTLIPGEKNHMGMLLFCDMVPDIMDAKKNRPGFSFTIFIFWKVYKKVRPFYIFDYAKIF